jgi:tRNA-splicing endonuclease subunit Sen34
MVEYRKRKADVFSANKKKNTEESSDRDDKYLKELKGNEQITIEPSPNRPMTYEDPATFWTFPVTKEERHRFLVFEDMWRRGYYLTNGSKFGGDFLAYSGDPLQFHAHYVVIVKPNNEELSPLDIISYGRLGVTVKKTPVLASVVDETSPRVSYLSIDWQGVT